MACHLNSPFKGLQLGLKSDLFSIQRAPTRAVGDYHYSYVNNWTNYSAEYEYVNKKGLPDSIRP